MFYHFYTNVSMLESIQVCTDLLFLGGIKKPQVDKENFCNIAMTLRS